MSDRKRADNYERDPLLNFRLNREKQARLRALAAERGVTVSALMREATDYVLEHQEKVPA